MPRDAEEMLRCTEMLSCTEMQQEGEHRQGRVDEWIKGVTWERRLHSPRRMGGQACLLSAQEYRRGTWRGLGGGEVQKAFWVPEIGLTD